MHLHPLYSDWLLYLLIVIFIVIAWTQRQKPQLQMVWRTLCQSRTGVFAAVVLLLFFVITLCDSIHLQVPAALRPNGEPPVQSLLDRMSPRLAFEHEVSYSKPLAKVHSVASHYFSEDETTQFGHAPLKWVYVIDNHHVTVCSIAFLGLAAGVLITVIFSLLVLGLSKYRQRQSWRATWQQFKLSKTAWGTLLITVLCLLSLSSMITTLAHYFHVFGTDRVGQDVFFESLKSIRTGVLIGTLSTLFMLPFAIILGMLSGYCRGWVDDVIQFIYTTLSAVPGVLLISATILVMQLYIQQHANLFQSFANQADARLIALCLVLGLTSWASLCRLLRAETLKVKTYDFVQAAQVMQISQTKILWRHILPNIFHLVLITIALDFSGLVLAEAVLSYVGVGVDPTTPSWGNMINAARLEMAREPVVWWTITAAMIMMFLLVLAANLFADTLRDALDPRFSSSGDVIDGAKESA